MQSLMATRHSQGGLPKIGRTLWYVATWQGRRRPLPTVLAVAAATIQRPTRNVRLVFDDLRMTENARRRPPVLIAPVGWNGFAVGSGPGSGGCG